MSLTSTMFLIILTTVAAVVCAIAAIQVWAKDKSGFAIIWLLLALLNVFSVIMNIRNYNEKKNHPIRHEIKDVVEYYVDTTTVISKGDTIKTYTITYFK